MAKRKYTIIDDNGENIGFIVIEQFTVFDHRVDVSPNSPMADATLFAVVLTGFTAAAWFLPGPGWLAPSIGITATFTLAGIKAWRGGILPGKKEGQEQVTIKLESWSDEGQVLLDEVRDQTISFEDWRKVAKAIVVDQVNFSRPALANYISQTTYHKVKDELTRLNMAHRRGNNYILSPRALAFLRKIYHLPY